MRDLNVGDEIIINDRPTEILNIMVLDNGNYGAGNRMVTLLHSGQKDFGWNSEWVRVIK